MRRPMDVADVLKRLVDYTHDAVLVTDVGTPEDPRTRIVWCNSAFQTMTGYTLEEVHGQPATLLQGPKTCPQARRRVLEGLRSEQLIREEMLYYRKDGSELFVDLSITPVTDEHGHCHYWLSVQRDVTETKQIEARLRHAAKLETVGRLAAGIAHEVNTPVQFISDNLQFLELWFTEMPPLLERAEQLLQSVAEGGEVGHAAEEFSAQCDAADTDFLLQEAPLAVTQCKAGVDHVREIVSSMKQFSHPGSLQKEAVSLNRAVRDTVAVARNEWSDIAELELDLDPELPLVEGRSGELNLVLLNLMTNAADAIRARGPSAEKGHIRICTRKGDGCVEARVEDSGIGIAADVRDHVFSPFFTTKSENCGHGQGLYIARAVVVDEHQGRLEFESEVGVGSTFTISLELTGRDLGECDS